MDYKGRELELKVNYEMSTDMSGDVLDRVSQKIFLDACPMMDIRPLRNLRLELVGNLQRYFYANRKRSH